MKLWVHIKCGVEHFNQFRLHLLWLIEPAASKACAKSLKNRHRTKCFRSTFIKLCAADKSQERKKEKMNLPLVLPTNIFHSQWINFQCKYLFGAVVLHWSNLWAYSICIKRRARSQDFHFPSNILESALHKLCVVVFCCQPSRCFVKNKPPYGCWCIAFFQFIMKTFLIRIRKTRTGNHDEQQEQHEERRNGEGRGWWKRDVLTTACYCEWIKWNRANAEK